MFRKLRLTIIILLHSMSLVTLLMLQVNDMSFFEREGFFDAIGDFALWCKKNNMIKTGGKRTKYKNKKTRRNRNKTKNKRGGKYGDNLAALRPSRTNAQLALSTIDSEEPNRTYGIWTNPNKELARRYREQLLASAPDSPEERDIINAIATLFEQLKQLQQKQDAVWRMRSYSAAVLGSQAVFLWLEYEKVVMLEEAKYNESYTAMGDKLVDKLTWAFSKGMQLASLAIKTAGMDGFDHTQFVSEYQKGRQAAYQALALAMMKPALAQVAMQTGIHLMFSETTTQANLSQQMAEFREVSERSLAILSAGIQENVVIANQIREAEASLSHTGIGMVAGAALFAAGVPQTFGAKAFASVPATVKLATAAAATDRFLDKLKLSEPQKSVWRLEINDELKKSYTKTLKTETESLPPSVKEKLDVLKDNGRAIAVATENTIKEFIAAGGDPKDHKALSEYVSENLFTPEGSTMGNSGRNAAEQIQPVEQAPAEQIQPVEQIRPAEQARPPPVPVGQQWICPNTRCNWRNSTFPLATKCVNCGAPESHAHEAITTFSDGQERRTPYTRARVSSASVNSARSGNSRSISSASVRDDDSLETYPDNVSALGDY